MLIRQTKNTFIRRYCSFGYITNQLTKHDRIYNETGLEFLERISRLPRDINNIVTELFQLYKDISIDDLKTDFLEFVQDLEKNWFLVTGNTPQELNEKDPTFSYKSENPKTKDIEKFKKMPVCGVGIDNICLAANGNYYPCAGWQGLVVGNAYQQSLKDIWKNSEQLKHLRTITNASFPDCIVCEARDYCAKCLVRNYNENKGDMMKIVKHFCDVAFLNKNIVEEYSLNK